jgi:TrmH family RNA methyltransferase
LKLEAISNRKLTLLRKLNQKKYRWKEQLFLVEGARAVEQIIQNEQLDIRELFFDESQKYWERNAWERYAKAIDSSQVAANQFAEVSDTHNPQGVIALCRMPAESDLKELASQSGIIIATDAIQDPGNMGTIIRTACWFGVKGLLLSKGTVDLFHPKVVRAAAGATGVIPYMNVELQKSLPFFEEGGWQIILLDAGSKATALKEIERQDKMLLVVGNEANGIDPTLFNQSRPKVCIGPRENGGIESLNAAIAAGIALYALH